MSKIENHSIFGSYSQTENRVTAALLQILKAGGTKFIENVIGAIDDDIDFPPSDVKIVTQERENSNVYDGKLECKFSFLVLIESKLSKGIDKKQLKGLINNAKKNEQDYDNIYILYITTHPDHVKPDELYCDNPKIKICLTNWKKINKILQDTIPNTELIDFLIIEFEKYLDSLDLLDPWEQRVQIAAGSWGERIAKEYGFYACQNDRPRKESKYLAFYHRKRISTLFEIDGTPENNRDITTIDDEKVRKYFDDGIEDRNTVSGSKRQFYKLKYKKNLNIEHTGKKGKGSAYTMGAFRYTTIDKIENAKTTDEL